MVKLDEKRRKELAEQLSRIIYPTKIERHPITNEIFYRLLSNGEIKTSEIEKITKEKGISIYRVRKWLSDLKKREILDTSFRGKPKIGGYWYWTWHPEFRRFIGYMAKAI